jgi:GMP synthase (glutamine-hydrolysing)
MTSCLAIRHVAFEDAGLLAPILARRGIDLKYVEAGIDPLGKETLLQPDLLVVLGGPIGVYETNAYPFLVEEIAGLRARLDAGRPTLGICLGAQLIAVALGARVIPGPVKEIGYAPLTLTEEGRASVIAPLDDVAVLHWHGDNLDLPPGAVRLASTKSCPNQAFTIGHHVLGLQFHIETPPQALERWLIGHACELASAAINPVSLRAQAAKHGALTASAGSRVLETWLDGALS